MKNTFTLRSVFTAITICLCVTVNAQEPKVIQLHELEQNVGNLVRINNVADWKGKGKFEADVFYNFNIGLSILVVKPTAALVGTAIPMPDEFSVIGTVLVGGDYGWYIEATSIVIPAAFYAYPGLDFKAPETAYVGLKYEFNDITLVGYNLPQGDITISLVSEDDKNATCVFVTDASAGTTSTSMVVSSTALSREAGIKATFSITPAAASTTSVFDYYLEDFVLKSTYKLQFSFGDEVIGEIMTQFPVKTTTPEITADVQFDVPRTELYVGEEYAADLFVKGNSYVEEKVILSFDANSGIISLSESELEVADVTSQWGKAVTVKFKASAVGKQTFPIKVKSGEYETTLNNLSFDFKMVEPVIKLSSATGIFTYNGDATVGVPFTVNVYLSANKYVTDDIIFAKKNAADNITFSPDRVSATAAQESQQTVKVTITPTSAASGKPQFPFTITAGDLKMDVCVQANFGVNPAPATSLESAKIETPSTKIIENGQLIIVRDGVRYNVLGTIIK